MRYLVILFVLLANTVFAQPAFESKHVQLLEAYHSKFGLPSLNNDNARAWTLKLAEQFAFSFPNEGWGHKAGGNGRPPSTDVIARVCCGGFWGYDVILSQGSPGQSLISRPEALNLAGQEFIQVAAVNHLGGGSGGNNGGNNPPPTPVDLGPLTARVTALESQLAAALARINELQSRDESLNKQHFELSDFAHNSVNELGKRIAPLESKQVPTGCSARFLGRNVGCTLIFQ